MYQIKNESNCDRGIHVRSGDARGLVSIPQGGAIDVSDEDLEDMRKNAQFRIWVDSKILTVTKKAEAPKLEEVSAPKATKKGKQEVVRTGFED